MERMQARCALNHFLVDQQLHFFHRRICECVCVRLATLDDS